MFFFKCGENIKELSDYYILEFALVKFLVLPALPPYLLVVFNRGYRQLVDDISSTDIFFNIEG
jgi:hypothetical protein